MDQPRISPIGPMLDLRWTFSATDVSCQLLTGLSPVVEPTPTFFLFGQNPVRDMPLEGVVEGAESHPVLVHCPLPVHFVGTGEHRRILD